MPASTSTTDNQRLIPATGNTLVPSMVPIQPPITAAGAQYTISPGTCASEDTWPNKPEIELTRMNATATPDVSLVLAQFIMSSTGLKKMPPPTPVRPESKPITAPIQSAATSGA